MKSLIPQPIGQSRVPSPNVDVGRLTQAIKNNETGSVKTNPYSFKQPSNSKVDGNANGAYQVTDAELKSYAPRYLGRSVAPSEFLNNPNMQDTYMKSKVASLSARGLAPAQILAVHRGGGSDLTPPALNTMMSKYQPYVTKGMAYYAQGAQGVPQQTLVPRSAQIADTQQ